VQLSYIEEPVILGTSGAIDNARAYLGGETFIVVNGKIATDIDLGDALATHRRERALATLVLRRNVERERYSTVEVEDGLVKSFGGYPAFASDNAGSGHRASEPRGNNVGDQGTGVGVRGASVNVREAGDGVQGVGDSVEGAGIDVQGAGVDVQGAGGDVQDDAPLMFTGIQILEPRIFDYIPRGVFSHTVTDVYVPAIARGERIAAHVGGGMWHELSTIRRYLDISLALMRLEGRDVEPGRGSVVEPGAQVSETILWEDARVEAGARVRRAVLGAGVRVARGELIEDAAVVRAALVEGAERPEKALAGELRGENFVVPLAQ
jgi:NDP-sugar pyrophosphorylase family protein